MPQTPATGVDGEVAPDDRLRRLRAMLERYRRRRGHRSERFVPTGLARLDRALPHGGLPGGAVTEILSPFDGVGATTLALRAAVAAAQRSRPVVVVDTRGDFYPPAMWRLGMEVDRLLVIRVRRPDEVVWAVDQSLRCSAVAAVVAAVPRLDDAASRRLQLAAENGGGVAILLRPDSRGRHSFAAVQMRVEPVAFQAGGMEPPLSAPRLCRVTLIKVREGTPVEPFVIGLDDETDIGPLLPVPDRRPVDRGPRVGRRISA